MDVSFEHLFDMFPPVHKQQWRLVAQQELKGESADTLRWKGPDGRLFDPIFDKDDTAPLEYLKFFQLPPDEHDYNPPRHWYNQPQVRVEHVNDANKLALEHLNAGADGIVFDLTKTSHVDVAKLLDKIELPYCRVSFLVTDSSIAEQFAALVNARGYTSVNGALYWTDPSIADTEIAANYFVEGYSSFGIWTKVAADITQELTTALHDAVSLLERVSKNEQHREQSFLNISFSMPATADFILMIAKMKAMRVLWNAVANAYGIKNYSPAKLQLHAHIESLNHAAYQPHGNMVAGTVSAMAAVLGGSNAITVFAEDEQSAMMNRMARNVSTILREEAHLDKVADPLAGAYTVDVLVDQLAESAWEKFLHLQSTPS